MIVQEKSIVIELKDKYEVKHKITERPGAMFNEAYGKATLIKN